MSVRLKIVAAVQANDAAWQLKKAVPKVEREPNGMVKKPIAFIEGTEITNIILLGDNVDVFVRSAADPANGWHITLCKPSVTILTSVGDEMSWRAAMSELDRRESVEEVTDLNDSLWQLNSAVPNFSDLTIVQMGMLGESIEIFAMPKVGTAHATAGIFFHFQLMPFFVQQVNAKSTMSDWVALQTEFMEEAAAQYEEEEEEDDDEDDDEDEDDTEGDAFDIPTAAQPPQQPQQPQSLMGQPPPPPPPPPMPNGAVTPQAEPQG